MGILSPELITDILLRLPVKHLSRLKSVSKSFKAIVDSPYFINAHFTNTRLNLIVAGVGHELQSTPIYVVDLHGHPKEALLLPDYPIAGRKAEICGSCKGLILLVGEIGEEVVLWNPSTKRHKKLPFCPTEIPAGSVESSRFGFGYDGADDDCKVVKICKVSVPGRGVLSKQAWIFSLRSNCWRRIRNFPFNDESLLLDINNGRFADGDLNWLCHRNTEMVILAFNLETETFREASKPDCLDRNYGCDLEILNGHLCVSVYGFDWFELYVREKCGVGDEFSWSKLYRIENAEFCGFNLCRPKPLAYSKDGDKVVLDDGDQCLLDEGMGIIQYDLKRKIGETIKINGLPPEFRAIVCWESLVLLGDDSDFDGAGGQPSKNSASTADKGKPFW